MKIGIASTCLWNFTPLKAVEFAKNNDIFSIEFWIDHINFYTPSYRTLKKSLNQNSIVPTVHAISWDINISSFSKEVRDFSIKEVYKSINIASEIEASILVVHPGRMSFISDNKDIFYKNLADSFSKIIQYANKNGVSICIENMENLRKELLIDEKDFISFFKLLNSIQHINIESMYVTMDVAHLGNYDRVKNFFDSLKDKIKHIHISDLTEDRMHIPIGEGILPYRKILSFLHNNGYRGIINLEYFNNSNDKSGIVVSINKLKEALKNVNIKTTN